MENLKEIKLNNNLKKDVFNTIGSIYSLNAPYKIGYLFNPNKDNRSIFNGMYCDFKSEININQWTYFYDCKDNKFYKILD